MRDRAVSDVVGFVLVVSLIISTVGVVYVFGIGGLQDTRDAERVNNAERAFDVLSNNMADLSQRNAPSRATEIKLSEADLGFGQPTVVNVSVTNGSTTNFTRKEVVPIVYSPPGSPSSLRYSNGAVIRTDRTGATMLSRPDTQFVTQAGDRVVLVPIIETRAGQDTGRIGGSTTALIRATTVTSGVLLSKVDADPSQPALDVTIDVTSGDETAAIAWERYLESEIPAAWDTDGDGDVCSRTAGEVSCTLTVDATYVSRTGISVRIA